MGILSSFPCIQWCLFHFIDTTICEAILWADSLNTLRGKLNLEEKSYYTQNPMQRWGPQVNILLCQKRWFALVPSTPEKSIFLAASKFWEWMMGEDENCELTPDLTRKVPWVGGRGRNPRISQWSCKGIYWMPSFITCSKHTQLLPHTFRDSLVLDTRFATHAELAEEEWGKNDTPLFSRRLRKM